ncbi:DNA-binding protein [Pseudomonas huanghezhanensis]|uniref:DNA-binding protein n=1 Tax=Pseudomonas huanghezhanensis TaxID=3002903 RepID=UPI002285E040|nr:DNA-binding protein [Pseudomonas sp. BSw22131]
MARGGVNKAVVQAARLALLARGENPSIDAVRIEMGNTGSKTTIHRYLRELDEGASERPLPEIEDELTELVAHLSQRLKAQAQERLDEAVARLDAKEALMREALNSAEKQLTELNGRYQAQTETLDAHTTALASTRAALQSEQTENARLDQALNDMTSRLADKDQQVRSLEEKHLHARDALEHFRNATKDQRDQELRRHEHQVQQVQMELRQAQQQASVRQDELTQLNRDNERLLAEARLVARDLKARQADLGVSEERATALGDQCKHAETHCALLQDRLQQAANETEALKQRVIEREQQSRVLELILIKTEVALEQLRTEKAQPAEEPDLPA